MMNILVLSACGYTAWILPERGGSCVRLCRCGAEALRTPKDMNAYPADEPFFYGTPPLFPPNRLSSGRFEFEGRTYAFPVNEPSTGCALHGALHETPMTVEHVSGNTARLFVSFTDDRPYLTFPHAFTFAVDWSLGGDGLTQRAHLTNDSPLNMPAAFGLHTAFNLAFTKDSRPEETRLALDTAAEYGRDDAIHVPNGQMTARHPFTDALNSGALYPYRRAVSRLYKMGARHEMMLSNGDTRVTYHADAPYAYWMLFGGGGRDYLCVEPQSWLTNAPNAPFPREETGFAYLRPGETATYQTRLSIEKNDEKQVNSP